eukprot:2762265-Amphidinium_carterae.2
MHQLFFIVVRDRVKLRLSETSNLRTLVDVAQFYDIGVHAVLAPEAGMCYPHQRTGKALGDRTSVKSAVCFVSPPSGFHGVDSSVFVAEKCTKDAHVKCRACKIALQSHWNALGQAIYSHEPLNGKV